MTEDSSSLSFLNLNWCESKEDTSMVYPFILEPDFTDYYIEISYRLEILIKKIKHINFTYKIVNENVVRIVDFNTKQSILEIGLCEYEKLEFLNIHNFKLYIVLDKLKYKKKITTRNNKIYKENVEQSKNIQIVNEYEDLKKILFDMQINHGINFIYVENEDDLFRELKSILKHITSKKVFIPKVKTFKPGKEQEYMEFILSKIPGISKCVAKNVAERYSSMSNLSLSIQNGHTNELSEMIIEDIENNKCRKLGVTQMNKIVQIFMSTDPTDKLI